MTWELYNKISFENISARRITNQDEIIEINGAQGRWAIQTDGAVLHCRTELERDVQVGDWILFDESHYQILGPHAFKQRCQKK
jgi:hypothetical protein